MIKYVQLFSTILLLICCSEGVHAQTTGKIAGLVFDEASNEPLVGANVYLVNTSFGAAVDEDGAFFILNVPPGSYTVVIQMIGYETINIENLRVSVNRTASVDAELKPSIMEGDVIVVQADKISTKKDQTSSMRTVSSDQMEILPVQSLGEVVAMQAGVVNGHFRGGRFDEVSYLIDGLQVDESFGGGGRTVELETEAVQDLEIITGTFNAEYGRAMSGIVNAVTRDGGNDFTGSITIGAGNYYTSNNDIFIGLNNTDFTRNQDYQFNLSGPILSNQLTFFTNVRYQDNKNHLNGIRRFNVDDYSDFANYPEDWISEHSGDGEYAAMNSSKNLSFMGKLTYRLLDNLRVSLLYTRNDDEWNGYDHAFKYNPDGRGTAYRETNMISLQANHMLSNRAFYELKLSYLDNQNNWYLFENPLDSRYIHDGYLRSTNYTGFFSGGQQKGHNVRTMKNINAKLDITWQVNNRHSLKSGILFINHEIDNQWSDIRNFYYGTDLEDNREFYEPVVFPDSSRYSDIYQVKPYEFAAYLQDKMEYQDMVINFGIRLDYFNPNTVYPSDRRNPSNKLLYADSLNRTSTYPEADAQIQISPRFGLAYQLGTRAVLHFSYGHFFQMPPMYALFQNHSFWLGGTDYEITMGNSQLQAQKTVQYEIGLWQELTTGMGLEIALFYRDIYDLLGTKIITTYNQVAYGLYTNLDYGNAKGLELKYDLNLGSFAAYLNYTLQYTRGNADNPIQNFDRAGNNQDPVNRLIPMSWDQRHTMNATVGYYQENYGVTITGYYNSGSPYTWGPIQQSTLAFINLSPNNDYRPSRYSVDLNAFYQFDIFRNFKGKISLLVYNLLDRLNEEWVNSQTGRAYTAIVQDVDLEGHRSDFNSYFDRIQNPSMYSAPRMMKVNLSVFF